MARNRISKSFPCVCCGCVGTPTNAASLFTSLGGKLDTEQLAVVPTSKENRVSNANKGRFLLEE